MNKRLFWKLCLIIGVSTVALFYVIDVLHLRTEEGMSFIDQKHQQQILEWGAKAEELYSKGKHEELNSWLVRLQQQENTWAAVIETELRGVAGSKVHERFYDGPLLARGVDWKIHLYFKENPIIEVTFSDMRSHFFILLPDRMRPGLYLSYVRILLQIILPILLLIPLTIYIYRHIMSPLRQLEMATRTFSKGNFDVRVSHQLGNRNDELTQLAGTFDQMATQIGDLVVNQRQLIADLSHELRTPLTRLDIAIEKLKKEHSNQQQNIRRVSRESQQIRKLVEDTLTFAWLDNEQPTLKQETLDLVDLLDVIIEDARYEFSDRKITVDMPNEAVVHNSNHRVVGQAIENILRNALRHTPAGKEVSIILSVTEEKYAIEILDQGPGVPDQYLEHIFEPFYRVDSVRTANSGFGLGLALARRQLAVVGGYVVARNQHKGGLIMEIILMKA